MFPSRNSNYSSSFSTQRLPLPPGAPPFTEYVRHSCRETPRTGNGTSTRS